VLLSVFVKRATYTLTWSRISTKWKGKNQPWLETWSELIQTTTKSGRERGGRCLRRMWRREIKSLLMICTQCNTWFLTGKTSRWKVARGYALLLSGVAAAKKGRTNYLRKGGEKLLKTSTYAHIWSRSGTSKFSRTFSWMRSSGLWLIFRRGKCWIVMGIVRRMRRVRSWVCIWGSRLRRSIRKSRSPTA